MTTEQPVRTRQTDAANDRIDRATWKLCWVVVLGAFATGLDSSIVNIGLDSITTELHSTLSTTQWIVSGYLLALAVSLPAAGWLGRRYGSGPVWLTALGFFTAASLACAVASTPEGLITARIAQGLAGGVLIPTGQTILGAAVGPRRLGRVMGVLGIAASAAPAIGPLVGGLILHSLPWPWLFAINVPIGIVGIMLGRKMLPCSRPSDPGPMHWTGLASISAGLALVVLATSRWGDAGRLDPATVAIAACAAAALATFVVATRRTAHPLLNLSLYRLPAFRAGSIAAACSGALVFGSGVVHALYFQLGHGQNPLHAGMSLIGVAAATAITAPAAGRWIDRHGPAPAALVGGCLAVATTLPLAITPLDLPTPVVQLVLVAYGASVSLVAIPAGVTAYAAVPSTNLADAITQVNILQRIGGSLGGAVCAVLIASHTADLPTGFRLAFGALVVGAVGSLLAALLIASATRPGAIVEP
ncbi:DHA2 family efflux MFS transporter permease subunit [Gordonia liuliyuniae]|uniref:DHA2 family efflux MFS transporter permease subunit n=1 Tax=Gordonia liuliyuniae TaxID=2911517 RepID=A0ABS9ITL4_9ACTN|nr:DHA2 family efflux MFS transporter permease subunit [Gordonia liuliyuniae]MCF8588837.1 DHA2 family efflux MFS transporter permease subunit [Gordonia liuliyuniae]